MMFVSRIALLQQRDRKQHDHHQNDVVAELAVQVFVTHVLTVTLRDF